MGNNAAFTYFEAVTLAVYNRGVLDKELLSELMKTFAYRDIDSGGMLGTLSHDGKDIETIVLDVFGVERPPKPDLPDDRAAWSEEQHEANDRYWDARYDKFSAIAKEHGWWR